MEMVQEMYEKCKSELKREECNEPLVAKVVQLYPFLL